MQSKLPRQRVSHHRLRCVAPHHAFGTLHNQLPLPAYRAGRLESAPHTPGFGQSCSISAAAWVRVSFAATRVSIVGWIYDPDHSLPPGMYVDVPHLDCLLVAAPITLEGLDHVILKPKQLDGVVAVNVPHAGGANLFFWTPGAMNGSTKVQSSQANSGCMLSGARRVHPVIVGCSTANRPLLPKPINDNR